MKLNLNFDLYKGKTALKHWWGEVKNHFTQVQTAHNDLEDTVVAERAKLSTEITQRANADIALSNRINGEVSERAGSDELINQRIDSLTQNSVRVRNCLLDIENYENGNLLTDSKGNKYLTNMVNFGDDIYAGISVEVNNFAKMPLYPSKLVFEIEVAGKHYSADNCDVFNILNLGESYIKMTYIDNTEEYICLGTGQSGISITSEPPTADIADNYTCYKIKTLFECTKQIKTLVFDLKGDNYTNDNETSLGSSCALELFVKKLACYDEESAAVIGDIGVLESTVNKEISDRTAADTALDGKIATEAAAREAADTALEDKISDGKAATASTIVIATNDSKNKETADYICDGTNDGAIINTAIQSMQNCGKIVLLEGNYYINETIIVSPGIILEGMGPGTCLNISSSTAGAQDAISSNTMLKMTNSSQIANMKIVYASDNACQSMIGGQGTWYMRNVHIEADGSEATSIDGTLITGGTVVCTDCNIKLIDASTAACSWIFRNMIVYCSGCTLINEYGGGDARTGLFYDCIGSVRGCVLTSDDKLFQVHTRASKQLVIDNCHISTNIINEDTGSNVRGLITDSYLEITGRATCAADIVDCRIRYSPSSGSSTIYGCRFIGNVVEARGSDLINILHTIFDNNVSKYRLCSRAETEGNNVVDSTVTA